jgi:hypothetical protein
MLPGGREAAKKGWIGRTTITASCSPVRFRGQSNCGDKVSRIVATSLAGEMTLEPECHVPCGSLTIGKLATEQKAIRHNATNDGRLFAGVVQ